MKARMIGAAVTLALFGSCGGSASVQDGGEAPAAAATISVYAPIAVADEPSGPVPLEDDLKAFAYASHDLTGLKSDVATIDAMLDGIASSRDPEAAAHDAGRLRTLAAALESSASRSAGRLTGLGPLDTRLQSAWTTGIDAFSATAAYAATVSDVATDAMTLDVQELRDVAQQAATVEGTTNDLANSYSSLAKELERWALENPDPAAVALARYGD
jgi:hypothetical protein